MIGMIEKLKAHLESPEGKASMEKYFAAEAERQKIRKKRHERFEEWLENNDFDELINRLILEHDNDYIFKCYDKGYMPSPNRKLSFVIGYIFDNFASISVTEIDCDFPNDIRQFKGYYFQHIHGQGTISRIYKKDGLKFLLQL